MLTYGDVTSLMAGLQLMELMLMAGISNSFMGLDNAQLKVTSRRDATSEWWEWDWGSYPLKFPWFFSLENGYIEPRYGGEKTIESDTRPNQVPVYFLLLDQQIWYITKFVSFYTPVFIRLYI